MRAHNNIIYFNARRVNIHSNTNLGHSAPPCNKRHCASYASDVRTCDDDIIIKMAIIITTRVIVYNA